MGSQKQRALTLSCIIAAVSIGAAISASAGNKLRMQAGEFEIEKLKSAAQLSALALGDRATQFEESASRIYILQFQRPLKFEEQKNIENAGLQLLRYIPDDAYLVRANEKSLRELAAKNSSVKAYAPYTAQFKTSPLVSVRSIFNKNQFVKLNLLVFRGSSAEAVADTLSKMGVIVEDVVGQNIAVATTNDKVEQIVKLEAIEWLTTPAQMKLRDFQFPRQQASPQDPSAPVGDFTTLTGYEPGAKIMGMDSAWSNNLTGQDQIVGISDTGLDTGDMTSIASDFTYAVNNSFAMGYGSTSWADHSGHGTHVSGTVATRGALSQGQVRGAAYDSKIVMESLWSDQYKTLTVPRDLGVLFDKSYEVGARIHSNSWGDPEKRGVYDTEAGQVDQFVWDHPEMLVLFAAGNDGADLDKDGRVDSGSVSSPATAKNILSIGASENLVNNGGIQKRAGEVCTAQGCLWPAEPIASDTFSNNPNGLAAFSSRGPTSDGRIKPDLVAPGTNILSDCSHMADASTLWGRFNADYCYSGGTSMATPLAAGAAAVARQYLMKQTDHPSAALLKAVMMNTAFDMYPGQYGEVGKDHGQEILTHAPNNDEGYGRVDISNLLNKNPKYFDEKVGVATGENKSYTVSGAVKKITLVYTDYPASPSSGAALVNNLDLEVHVGDLVLKSSSSIDNTEQVTLDTVANGEVTIVVIGTNVPMGNNGKQPFALVYSTGN